MVKAVEMFQGLKLCDVVKEVDCTALELEGGAKEKGV
jgi:hypothetical protein